MALEALLKHPALWKGRQRQRVCHETLSTGYPQLDAVLPAQGWPIGALTEIMSGNDGIGEFSLLLPALCHLTRQQHWIALIAPPYIPYAPALMAAGLALDRTLVVDAETDGNNREKERNDFWAAEQLLRSGIFSAVILWCGRTSNDRTQRRLQLAAEHGKCWAVCYRPERTTRTASPAGLRMLLKKQEQQLYVDIIKNRGGRMSCIPLQQETRNKQSTLRHLRKFDTTARLESH